MLDGGHTSEAMLDGGHTSEAVLDGGEGGTPVRQCWMEGWGTHQ